MSVRTKILVACLGFVAIIAVVGGMAQIQAGRMGRLAIGIYDHAFMGMSYVDQAQEEFLRLEASHREAGAALAGNTELTKVLELLDVALERAASDRTRDSGEKTRVLIAALAGAPADALAARMTEADRALTKLVKKFAADGLDTRDDAEALAASSTRAILIQIAVAVGVALGVGWLVGRSLSVPLVRLVGAIGRLAGGDLEHEITVRLARRRDEIGALARTAAVFREAMQQNAKAAGERERQREESEAEKVAALRGAADAIERETASVSERSAESGNLLAARAHDLAASAARMMVSVGSVREASDEAMASCQVVAAAGEELSASAREIASQITASTAEIGNTVRAGERAHQIIEQLSASMGQIGSMAKLIGETASRTDLLALNATIEAARAGEAGRGFAVVASEVKALATQTARSNAEITRGVNAIQAATLDAVKVVGEMVERVRSIEQITHAVAGAVDQQTAATGEIARSVQGTAETMRVVTGQIGSVTEEARGTDAAVAEMQSVAGAVAEQIGELRGVMVRILRTSTDAMDRRRDERIAVNAPAVLEMNGRSLPVTCLNLSCGGAQVSADEPLAEGAGVVLRLANLPALPGTVLSGGREVSLRFAWEAEAAPPELRDWLGRRAA